MAEKRKYGLGCLKDPADKRDIPMGKVLPPVTAPPEVDYTDRMSPVRDQGDEGTCLIPDTEVLMADMTLRKIKDIKAGEYVISGEGIPRMVSKVTCRTYKGDLIDIAVEGHRKLRLLCTPEHPIACENEWRQAGSLKVYSYRNKEGRKNRCNEPVVFDYEGSQNLDGCGLDEKFGRIVGFYLAEGLVRKQRRYHYHGIEFCFGKSAIERRYAEEIIKLMGKVFGVRGKLRVRGNKTNHSTFYDAKLAEFFDKYFSTGCENKRLPDVCMRGSKRFKEALIKAWLEGDGWKSKSKTFKIVGVTISEMLAKQLFIIMRELDFNVTLCRSKTRVGKNRFDLYVYNPSVRRTKIKEKFLSVPVRSVVRRKYSGLVHNLEIETDNSYIANFISVHNCVAFASVVGVKECQEREERGRLIELSPRYLYHLCKQRDGVPGEEGTYPRVAMKVLCEKGVCREECWPYRPYQEDGPCPEADKQAYPFRIRTYARLSGVPEMERSLSVNGPFLSGVQVFPSWFEKHGGKIPLPSPGEESVGGHAVCVVGYSRKGKFFKFKNSWGTDWGEDGYGYLPYDYLELYSLDSWSATDLIASADTPRPGEG